jgi:hypothetical protein
LKIRSLRGNEGQGTPGTESGLFPFAVDDRTPDFRIARDVVIWGVKTGPQSPPANPPLICVFSALSTQSRWVVNATGILNELRNRRIQVQPLTGANSTAAVILDWIPAAVFLCLSLLRPDGRHFRHRFAIPSAFSASLIRQTAVRGSAFPERHRYWARCGSDCGRLLRCTRSMEFAVDFRGCA